MKEKNQSLKLGLIKKALRVWIQQYHFYIPPAILKMYISKYLHERNNISKYGARFFNPSDPDQYNRWLSFRTEIKHTKPQKELQLLTESETLDLNGVDSQYVLLVSKGCHTYPVLGTAAEPEGDVIYFDHDCRESDGRRHDPVLKPDFSYNTLRSFNYIGRCFAVKTELLRQFDGEQWNPYYWLLKLSDQNLDIRHVAEIAYSDSMPFVCEADTLRKYFADSLTKADVTVNPDGISCTVIYSVENNPMVSILIPTRDGIENLDRCVSSVFSKSVYPNFEIVIVDNGSEKQETLTYFKKLKEEHNNVSIIRIDAPFNFAYLNNSAARHAKGDYFVLLNNDTEIITADWLNQMLGYAQRKNVGSVGTMLYYEDGSIQHGGVIVGKGGAAAHRWYRCSPNKKGYLYTLEAPNDVSCCTAACLMTSRKCWEELGGMNEALTVQFNDVDYGLRLLKAGYFNVFLPGVKLYHYESKTRGIDKNPRAVRRFFEEVDWFKDHYGSYIEHDPFYNDQFDKNYDYMLIAGTGSN